MRKALLGALALAACAHDPASRPVNDAAATLAAAETAFAAHSVREGMRPAFLAHFADDGVFVRAGWTVSNTYLATQPNPPIVLDWRPAYVEAADSGDLGLSTGPWKITSPAKPADPPTYGQYVSVWRRQGEGPWRVAVDLGIAHRQPDLWDQPLTHGPAGSRAAAGGAATIEAAEAAFAKLAAASGLRAAHVAHGADRLRFYRTGASPSIGKAASLAALTSGDERSHWTVERTETSRAGDFGYARGAYADPGSGKTLGWYLRVWRREEGAWRVILDVTNPAPRTPTS